METITNYSDFPVSWELDEYMDLVANIAERKSYFVKLAFVGEDEMHTDSYKVWEVNDGEYMKWVIDQ